MTALAAVASFAIVPFSASAQSYRQHRRNEQNTWRTLGYGAGALGLLGLLKGDNTLFFAGAAGAAYSAYRLDQDAKSHDRHARARAAMFRRTSFRRNGHLYVRKTIHRHGQTYYQFVRA